MSVQKIIRTPYANNMFLYAEIKNLKWYHKLGWVSKFVNLTEDEDYILVSKKPICTIIIPNSNDNYNYKVGCRVGEGIN